MQIRAGEQRADALDIGNSNPVNKNSYAAELTSLGKQQILGGMWQTLRRSEVLDNGTWIWASITSSSYQTAAILANLSGLGQSRVVPEYSFLEPRGLGALDGLPLGDVMPLLREGDASSLNWRPRRGATRSAFFLAETSVSSPRKLFIFIIQINIFWIKVSKKLLKLNLKKEALGASRS